MADEQDSSRLAKFAPRERSSAESHQPFRTSLIFVGIALVLSLVTVLWLGLFNQRDEIRLEITDIKVDKSGEVELTGAVYRGQTARGEPYEIVADTARERDTGQVDLSAPAAEVKQASGDVVNITSQTGVYFPKRSEIDLAGDVVIISKDTGLVMTSQAITANLDSGEMVSNQTVRVENNSGFVVADSMQVKERGDRIIFAGNPRLILRDVGTAQ